MATLVEMEALIEELGNLETELAALKTNQLKIVEAKIRGLKTRIIEELDEAEINSFKGSKSTVTKKLSYSVKVPSERADKEAYFTWLRSKNEDLYWDHISVNSRTLTAFVNEQMDIAAEENKMDVVIPGIGPKKASIYLSVTKRKG